MTYKVSDYLFVVDTLFAPERGTSRVDFLGGSAHELYHSIGKLYGYPDEYHVQLCHDYPQKGETPALSVTLYDEKHDNVMLNIDSTEKEYTQRRRQRDAELAAPKLMDIAVPFNLTHELLR